MTARLSVDSFDLLLDRLDLSAEPVVARHAGLCLRSHFQPIYSLAHGRVVGHEALLRASDAQGRPVSPPEVFAACGDFAELLWRDRLARMVHVANYLRAPAADQWLFINIHPQVFAHGLGRPLIDGFLQRLHQRFPLPHHRMVIEVMEEAVRDDADFHTAVERARAAGYLIALDDFGAGHSNFDRVWRLRPEIVKLDRSLVMRAAGDAAARRIVVQMVSLLHECGALVLMEGVETEAEAHVALEADADLVQGYLFGRPQPALVPSGEPLPQLHALSDDFELRSRGDKQRYRERIGPYINAIGYAASLLGADRSLQEACRSFLELPEADVCYLLGSDGGQIGDNQWAAAGPAERSLAYEPLRDTQGARWARRPYFRRAVESVGKVQVTRPYRTLHGGGLCVTVSAAFPVAAVGGASALQVICGDLHWAS
jgi:EAL domain-containing protein (putative c-di-GMP-specific phosphodiesterase class I)